MESEWFGGNGSQGTGQEADSSSRDRCHSRVSVGRLLLFPIARRRESLSPPRSMPPTPWQPTRVVVAANAVPGLPEYLEQHRPRLAIRAVPLAELKDADLQWAEVFV